jgi:predicted regulator of Ras-like GTPase activity (Roadblock/LC7/MglB family)
MIFRWFIEGRLRKARRRVANRPTPSGYVALAQEHVRLRDLAGAQRVCLEGQRRFPGNGDLARFAARVRKQGQEHRLALLEAELAQAPRPGLYQSYAELLLECGQIARAEESAEAWRQVGQEPEATLLLARVLAERFLSDRGRDVGQRLYAVLKEAEQGLPRDSRPHKLRLRLSCLIGAWADAKEAVVQLLDLHPGEPALEARFRSLEAKAAGAPSVEQALRSVEQSGQLFEDVAADKRDQAAPPVDVRGVLKDLAGQEGLRAALYLRGATALIEGPKAATAERTARVVRSMLHGARSSSRRLALGSLERLEIEGRFGRLMVVAGERDAAALWSTAATTAAQMDALVDLVGGENSAQEAA